MKNDKDVQSKRGNIELEAKFDFDEADYERLKAVLSERFGDQHAARELRNIYFDTADLALRNARVALRMRSTTELSSSMSAPPVEWEQTVKAGGSVRAGLHSRMEWNCPLGRTHSPTDRPAMNGEWLAELFDAEDLLPAPPSVDLLLVQFETNFKRVIWLITETSGTAIEIALDRGLVLAGSRSVPLCELEIELKAGAAVDLDRFVASLYAALQVPGATVKLTASSISKAARGFRLVAENDQSR